MNQLIQPNLAVIGYPDYCEKYTEDVFGVPASSRHEADAFLAWADARFKHPNQVPPIDISVPIYFNWTGNVGGITKNWGHACVWVKGQVYTTPLRGTGHLVYPSIGAIQKAFGLGSYLGWTEDIENLRIVEEEVLDQSHLDILNFAFFGGDKSPPSGLTIGRPVLAAIEALNSSPERQQRIARLNQTAAEAAKVPALEKQIADLQAQLKAKQSQSQTQTSGAVSGASGTIQDISSPPSPIPPEIPPTPVAPVLIPPQPGQGSTHIKSAILAVLSALAAAVAALIAWLHS